MPGKGFKTTALEEDVLSELRSLSYQLSAQEDRRVTLSDTVRLLIQTYNAMNTAIPANGTIK